MPMQEQPTVVVVDDEQPIVDVVCDVLDDEGFHTVGCTQAMKAVDCIRQCDPKLVILDVQMPGVDGVEIFQRLRTDAATSEIPVIFFTANAHVLAQRLPDFAQKGALLLPKPFNVDRLLHMVQDALAA
jgi:CheY-like chemotaxis protein